MSEQVLKSGNVMERSRTRTITQIAMLGSPRRNINEF